MTFTTKAAAELAERLAGLGVTGVQARTFHSAALRQLRYFWPRAVGGAPPTILESVLPRIDRAAIRVGLRLDAATRRDYADAIKRAKVNRITAERLHQQARSVDLPESVDLADLARLYLAYDEVLAERGERDLEDVLLLTVAILEEHPDALDEVRRRYRWFTVDEFQDVNPLQMRLVDLWAGQERELCVVGDAAQTIYSFTGATSTYLTDLAMTLPPDRVIRLHRSYRCPPPVVEAANRLQRRFQDRRASIVLVSGRPVAEGPFPQVRIVECADEPAEAAWVAEEIAGIIARGGSAAEVAVLYRLNAQSQSFEEALARRGISYRVRGSERFSDRPVVRQALTLLRGAAKGARGEGVARLSEQVRDALGPLASAPPRTGPSPVGRLGSIREREESVAVLIGLAERFESAIEPGTADMAGFIEALEQQSATGGALDGPAVTLSTMHAAKGLEWPTVVVVGAVDAILPGQGDPEEERRLCYVAVTRARRDLIVTWARSRSPGGTARVPSRFLGEIGPPVERGQRPGERGRGEQRPGERGPGQRSAGRGVRSAATGRTGESASPPERVGARRRAPGRSVRCPTCGKALTAAAEIASGTCTRCAPAPEAGLIARLRSWRLESARAQGVPAFLVLTDVTLGAIAQIRPRSAEELAAIPGIGPHRLSRYGEEILSLVAGPDGPGPDGRRA